MARAYRRGGYNGGRYTRSGSASRGYGARSGGYRTRRRATSTRRRSSGGQTVKVVIEHQTVSPVSRPAMPAKLAPKPRQAKY